MASAWSELAPPAATTWKSDDTAVPEKPALESDEAAEDGGVRAVSAEGNEAGPAFGLTADGRESGAGSASEADQQEASGGGCDESNRECREALRRLRDDGIASINLDIRVGGRPGNDYPCECRLEGETFKPRCFATTTFTWKAAGYCHKPLYFEQPGLERYGHSYGFIPDFFLSGAHFFVTLPILPYKMGVELPWECVYPLGYYRPGNCAPWTCPAVPFSVRGLALEAATITGVVFLLP